MHITPKSQKTENGTSLPLRDAKVVFANLTCHCDQVVIWAANQIAIKGKTKQERDRAMTIAILLKAAQKE